MPDVSQASVEGLRASIRDLSARMVAIPDQALREEVDQRLRDLCVRLARLERRELPASRPDPPGRVFLGPLEGLDIFIARRWFTMDGERVERDEIIIPTTGYWQDRGDWRVAIEGGWLEPLAEDVLAWACPHVRLWANPTAIEAHGCCELSSGDSSNASLDRALPPGLKGRRAEVLRKWRAGKTRSEIATELDMSPVSVDKRIGEMRRDYGEVWVPYRRGPEVG
jgi:DNA-binding CsgD family transcriptional regulator